MWHGKVFFLDAGGGIGKDWLTMELVDISWIIYISLMWRQRHNTGQCFAIKIDLLPPVLGTRKLGWSLSGCLLALGNLQRRDKSLTLGPAWFSIPPETLQGTSRDDQRRICSSFLPRRSRNLQRKLHLPSFPTREKKEMELLIPVSTGASNAKELRGRARDFEKSKKLPCPLSGVRLSEPVRSDNTADGYF